MKNINFLSENFQVFGGEKSVPGKHSLHEASKEKKQMRKKTKTRHDSTVAITDIQTKKNCNRRLNPCPAE